MKIQWFGNLVMMLVAGSSVSITRCNAKAAFVSFVNDALDSQHHHSPHSSPRSNIHDHPTRYRLISTSLKSSADLRVAITTPSSRNEHTNIQLHDDFIYDPITLCDGKIPFPVSLSPSSAAEFKACPQSYLFQYLYGIKQRPNHVLVKGTMCHKALEQMFDLSVPDRTLNNLHNLFRKNWSQKRLSEEYRHLFQMETPEAHNQFDVEAERDWGKSALDLLTNYYELEDPKLIPYPNPIEREIWVNAHLSVDSLRGVTGYTKKRQSTDERSDRNDTFLMRGIVDRIDLIVAPSNSPEKQYDTELALRIVDYKSGKAPDFKYSPDMNEKIAEDNLWQLKIYALLIREMLATDQKHSTKGNLRRVLNIDLRFLRLMYLTSTNGKAMFIDMDLGNSKEGRDLILQDIHSELSEIWKNITSLVQRQDPRAFVHCDRKYCVCHSLRSKFKNGTVWSRDS